MNKVLKKILRVISKIIFIFLLIIMVFMLIYVVRVKIFANNDALGDVRLNFYTILSPSMHPTIKAGDVIITYRADNYKKDDIITFVSDSMSTEGITITHRIQSISGNDKYITKGDNNSTADSKEVAKDQVLGKVIFTIPKAGYIQQFLVTKVGWIALILIPCLGVVVYDVLKIFKITGKNSPLVKKNNELRLKQEEKIDKFEKKKEKIEKEGGPTVGVIKDFFRLFGNCIIIIGIMMASFLLLINLYHYSYISRGYNVNVDETLSFKNMKENVAEAKNVLAGVNTSKLSVEEGKISNEVLNNINSCIAKIEQSEIYTKTGVVNYNYYNVYTDNTYLYVDINRECFTMLKNNTNNSLESSSNIKNSYEKFDLTYQKLGNALVINSEYLSNKSLSNNSYNFVSDMSRMTVFNDLKNDFDLTLRNYEYVSSLIVDLSEWYALEFGGDINE